MKNVCFRSTHYKVSQILTLDKILWAWKVFSIFEEPKRGLFWPSLKYRLNVKKHSVDIWLTKRQIKNAQTIDFQ